jgi:multicomponent Na+:H+ antiporter subunit B
VSRGVRLLMFGIGAGCVAAMFAVAFFRMPAFGGTAHLYRDLAVPASVAHQTANVISSVNFAQRGFDTLGEETILLTSVVAATVLLRPAPEESRIRPERTGRILQATTLVGYLLLPGDAACGVRHRAARPGDPGRGFPGRRDPRRRPVPGLRGGGLPGAGQAAPARPVRGRRRVGSAVCALLGIAGIVFSGAFLGNIIPSGTFGQLLSAGSVPVFNDAVGLEVGCAMAVLLAHFLQQDIIITAKSERARRRAQGGSS